ncbi:hypothetical protein BU17DRAFT_53006, partial [Hysterangium stoloniferum]
IVLIHGLDGHPVKSCMTHNHRMWFCNFLPYDLVQGRILSFGYDGYTEHRNQFSETLVVTAKTYYYQTSHLQELVRK